MPRKSVHMCVCMCTEIYVNVHLHIYTCVHFMLMYVRVIAYTHSPSLRVSASSHVAMHASTHPSGHADTHTRTMQIGTAAEGVPALAAAKDFAALVALMREHPADPVVARAVCEVFHDLASGNNDANRQAIGAAGGAEVVVLALKQHLAVASVAEWASRAAVNLAAHNNDANQAALAAAGGIEALTAVLHEHAANAEVKENACWALYNIGASDRALQKRIWEAGAEPVVRAAVNAPDATADTREEGQRLLDKLAEVSVCVMRGCVYTRAPVPAMASVSEYV